MEERLQKIIARAGVASRRRAEQLIVSGQVTVNGRVVTELGTRADAARDHIKVSGKLLQGPEEHVYIALHKPAEVVATLSDPEGRRSLADLLVGVPARVYPVGRLEYHASGLVFLTNDGELANKMLRAHGLRQTYLLKVKGNLSDADVAQVSAAARARIQRMQRGDNPWYEANVAEVGRDSLREQLAAMGHPVEKMKRIKIASLEIGDLPPGRWRDLTLKEIAGLEAAVKKSQAHPPSSHASEPARPPRRQIAARGRRRG
jgi:23S rRNA pseudouridine2605 synthase